MRKYRTSGSVRGAPGNRRVYRDYVIPDGDAPSRGDFEID